VTGPLAGKLVLEGGAGTGIATRQLAGRGARTVAFDIAEQMLRRAHARGRGPRFLLADGNAMPLRDHCADLTCFAQSWHWFDQDRAAREVEPLLARIADIAAARFPGGQMSVPYRTRLRLARRRLSPQA
jgi:SAM-dependent methyltransferase